MTSQEYSEFIQSLGLEPFTKEELEKIKKANDPIATITEEEDKKVFKRIINNE